MPYRCSVCKCVGHNKATCDLHLLNTIAPVLNKPEKVKRGRGRPKGSKNKPKTPISPTPSTPISPTTSTMTEKDIVSIVSGHFNLPVDVMYKLYNSVYNRTHQGKPLPVWWEDPIHTDDPTLRTKPYHIRNLISYEPIKEECGDTYIQYPDMNVGQGMRLLTNMEMPSSYHLDRNVGRFPQAQIMFNGFYCPARERSAKNVSCFHNGWVNKNEPALKDMKLSEKADFLNYVRMTTGIHKKIKVYPTDRMIMWAVNTTKPYKKLGINSLGLP